MSVATHLRAAMKLGLTANPQIWEKWIAVSFRLSGLYGWGHSRVQGDSYIDMTLRVLDGELLSMQKEGHRLDIITLNLHLVLSEQWILSTYETVRAATITARKTDQGPRERLVALRDRLALVRMPIAKLAVAEAKLTSAEREELAKTEFVRIGEGPRVSEPYGSSHHLIQRGSCIATGSVSWLAYNPKTRRNIWVSRRSLSDEFLALFD